MNQIPDQQRCFTIPKYQLDLLLKKLKDLSGNKILLQLEAAFIFERIYNYDVVVNYYGSYPYQERILEEYINELQTEGTEAWHD